MSDPETVDVKTIVDGIRDEITRRRAAGDLTREDIEWLLDQRLRASIKAARIDDTLAARLLHPSHDWNIDTGYAIRTRRRGLSGLLIRAAKALARPFVRLYTDHILNRQAQVNLAVWHILIDSLERSVSLEMDIRRLEKEVKDLKGSD